AVDADGHALPDRRDQRIEKEIVAEETIVRQRTERPVVASKSKFAKQKQAPKFTTRFKRRCNMSGRPRAVYRKFGICRICFRKLADQGLIPGVRKASW